MKTELSAEQVNQLFEFTRKHYVEYYDVQVELVDHLASSIENEREQNPNLSFDEALNNVFRGFGIFGFDGITEQKASATNKKQRKHWQKTFINLLMWPNMLKSFCLYAVLYLLFTYLPKEFSLITIGFLLIGFSIYFLIKEFLYIKRNLEKKLVLITARFQYLGLVNFTIYFFRFFGDWFLSQHIWIISLVISVIILVFIAYQIASRKVFEEARILYPEAFKSPALT
jgi:hypothetical protein